MLPGGKDVAFPLQWLGSLLWRRLDPWSKNFHLLQFSQKKIISYWDLFSGLLGVTWRVFYPTNV